MSKFFKTIEEVKKFLTTESDFRFGAIDTYLNQVEANKLTYELGVPFFTALSARYADATPNPALTAEEIAAIAFIQNCIAHLGAVVGMPSLMVSLSGSGLLQKVTGDQKGLFQWQKIDFENSHLDLGYNGIETVIEYLWLNRDNAQFATWKNSDAEKRSRAFFVNTAKEFNEYYPIASSRRTFEAIKSSIRDGENGVIKPILGKELFDEIKSQIVSFSISAANAKLMGMLSGISANVAIGKAISLLTFKVTSEGLMVTTIAGTGNDSFKNQTTPTDTMVRETKAAAKLTADSYINDLIAFLNENVNDYPLFKNSEEYLNNSTVSNINSTHTKVVSL